MIEVRNRASVLFDHTSYLDNTEQFVAPVALALAELAGMNWFDLIEGDAHRLVEAQRRRCALVARKQWIGRWGLAAVLIGSLAAYLAGPLTPDEAFGVLRTLWNGPTLQEWGTALRHLPHALVAALPVAIAAALFVVERILLHLRFESSASELTSRMADAPMIPHWAVRVVGYGAGIAGIAWWIDHVDLVSAVARRLAG
jgi:hypothetical protein